MTKYGNYPIFFYWDRPYSTFSVKQDMLRHSSSNICMLYISHYNSYAMFGNVVQHNFLAPRFACHLFTHFFYQSLSQCGARWGRATSKKAIYTIGSELFCNHVL